VGNKTFIGNNFILGQQRSGEMFVLQSSTVPSEILIKERGSAVSWQVVTDVKRVASSRNQQALLFINPF
jgi:hypothetical protein